MCCSSTFVAIDISTTFHVRGAQKKGNKKEKKSEQKDKGEEHSRHSETVLVCCKKKSKGKVVFRGVKWHKSMTRREMLFPVYKEKKGSRAPRCFPFPPALRTEEKGCTT
jgi:hypothetical protein